MNRRGFLTGLATLVAAPAVIRTPGLLMPVRGIVTTAGVGQFSWYAREWYAREFLKLQRLIDESNATLAVLTDACERECVLLPRGLILPPRAA